MDDGVATACVHGVGGPNERGGCRDAHMHGGGTWGGVARSFQRHRVNVSDGTKSFPVKTALADMRQPQNIAVVDRALGKLKKLLSTYSLKNWVHSLKKARIAYNENSHAGLMGSLPNDVKTSPKLQYEIEKNNGLKFKHNNDKWRAKAGKLRDAGAFRVPLPRDTRMRWDAPQLSGEVHDVVEFKGANVSDGTKSFPVKTALAVPTGSTDISIGR